MKTQLNSALILTLALATTSVLAGGVGHMDSVDIDKNGTVSKIEFEQYVGEQYFGKADRNDDGMIDDTEFMANRMGGSLEEFDRDSDGRLTRTEWHTSVFDKFDTNSDRVLDKSESKDVQSSGIGM